MVCWCVPSRYVYPNIWSCNCQHSEEHIIVLSVSWYDCIRSFQCHKWQRQFSMDFETCAYICFECIILWRISNCTLVYSIVYHLLKILLYQYLFGVMWVFFFNHFMFRNGYKINIFSTISEILPPGISPRLSVSLVILSNGATMFAKHLTSGSGRKRNCQTEIVIFFIHLRCLTFVKYVLRTLGLCWYT